MRTLKYFLAYASKYKARVYQLYFIGALLQEHFNNRVFVKLESRYADFSRIFKIFWKSFEIIEFRVWYD